MTDLVLNKNFYNYIGCILFGGFVSGSFPAAIGTPYGNGKGYYNTTLGSGEVPCQLVTLNNEDSTVTYFGDYSQASTYWNHSFFYFNQGSGGEIKFVGGSDTTTAATVNDTALVSPNASISATILSGERATQSSVVYTVKFSSSDEQTLGEIGISRDIKCKVKNTNSFRAVLLGRCKLDQPILLNEDNNYSVTLQIRLSLPIPA